MSDNATKRAIGPELAWRLAGHYRIDETTAADSDRRFTCYTAEGPGRTFATILRCPSVAALSPSLRRLMGITTARGSAMIIGGGSLGAGAVYEDHQFPGSLADLLRRERAEVAPDTFVVAPAVPRYVPEDALSADGVARYGTERHWFYQQLDKCGDLSEYITGQPRKVRQTLARDTRVAEDLDVSVTPVAPEHQVLQDAAALFAAVERNNGEPGDARLTAWRVRTLVRAARRAYVITATTGPDREPISYTLLRELVPDVLDVSLIGIADDITARRDIYHVGAFLLPLQFAISHGFDLVLFGREHAGPKRLRGLQELRGVDVYFGPG